MDKENVIQGTYLVVQWLRLHASNAGVQVQSLVRELSFHVMCNAHPASKKNSKKKNVPSEKTKDRHGKILVTCGKSRATTGHV